MNKDFREFQEYFKEYQKEFGLLGYRIYFEYAPIGPDFAAIRISQTKMVADVRLNSELLEENKKYKNIRQSAKHEAIHLLVARLAENGRHRYIPENEIEEAEEELVERLVKLLP